MTTPSPRTSTSGWVVFAGVLTALAAAGNLIYGITLLANDDWVVLAPEAVWAWGDLMNVLQVFPNMVGLVGLSGVEAAYAKKGV